MIYAYYLLYDLNNKLGWCETAVAGAPALIPGIPQSAVHKVTQQLIPVKHLGKMVRKIRHLNENTYFEYHIIIPTRNLRW